MDDFRKMLVYGVSFDVMNRQPIVLLKVEEENRFLPIWIGHPEAASILMKLQNTQLPRPMTHDLVTNILTDLSTTVDMVMVTELKDNTFYAVLRLRVEDHTLDVDSRPSDAIALAVRTDAPIFASATLLETNGIEFDQEVQDAEEIVQEFKSFLDEVSPDDFSS